MTQPILQNQMAIFEAKKPRIFWCQFSINLNNCQWNDMRYLEITLVLNFQHIIMNKIAIVLYDNYYLVDFAEWPPFSIFYNR